MNSKFPVLYFYKLLLITSTYQNILEFFLITTYFYGLFLSVFHILKLTQLFGAISANAARFERNNYLWVDKASYELDAVHSNSSCCLNPLTLCGTNSFSFTVYQTHTHTLPFLFLRRKHCLSWPPSSTPLIPASRNHSSLLAHNPAKSNMASMGHSHLSWALGSLRF